jgi:hypothetical protein
LSNHPLAYRAHARRRPAIVAPGRPDPRRPYGIQDELDFIKVQLSLLPRRNEVRRAAMLGMLGGAVAAVTIIEAFVRACNWAVQLFWWGRVIGALFAIVFIFTRE